VRRIRGKAGRLESIARKAQRRKIKGVGGLFFELDGENPLDAVRGDDENLNWALWGKKEKKSGSEGGRPTFLQRERDQREKKKRPQHNNN